jgi:SAM-dependent methyltransferase
MTKLDPRMTSAQYAVRRPLVDWLRSFDVADAEVLDVGCGDRPYAQLFPSAVGFDIPGNPHADLHGSLESIPVGDASFDVVLCLQVLEHVPDPAAAVRELHRVVKPGGRVLLSTHGIYPFHPNPDDLWRWTHQGLERVFLTNGEWTSVSVQAGAGTASTVAMLVAHVLDLACKRAHARPAALPLIAGLNAAGRTLDGLVPPLAPGTLHANYHVEAVR